MGRPLNKKYFGNRNIGTGGYQVTAGLSNSQNYADDNIGGEGVAGVSQSNVGAYLERMPTVSFKVPSIPGGVRATGVVTNVAAVKATVATIGDNYAYGDQFTVVGGTGDAATFSVSALQTVGIAISNDGSAVDTGDEYTFSGSYAGGSWTTPLVVRITSSSGGNATGFTVLQAGVWTGSAAPTNTVGATRTQTAAGQDFNGVDLQFNLTSYGVSAVTLVDGGDYTEVWDGATLMDTVTGTGSGCYTDVYYGVSAVNITEKGSGYISVADALPTFSTVTGAEVRATGAAVLTTDNGGYASTSGDTMNAGNQENSILIYAKTTDVGGAPKLGDIIKQVNARSYKVKTDDGTAIVQLVAAVPTFGQATITATDQGGATYFVTKLTAHKALLTSTGTGTPQFEDGTSVVWTLGSATENYSVTIDNA